MALTAKLGTGLKRSIALAKTVAAGVRYYTPHPLNLANPSSPRANELLTAFRRDGIVKVDTTYPELARHLADTYFAALSGKGQPLPSSENGRLYAFDIDVARYAKGAPRSNVAVNISFRDPALEPLLFDTDLAAMLTAYYRRQAYFRNQPRLYRSTWDGVATLPSSSHYHVDPFHQVSYMLLIDDVQVGGMHMRYAVGSHRKLRVRFNSRIAPELVESEYPIVDLVGPAGTLYVFDAGGIHRGSYVPHAARRMLHLNVTPGHNIEATRVDLRQTWAALDAQPSGVRRMFDKILIGEASRAY